MKKEDKKKKSEKMSDHVFCGGLKPIPLGIKNPKSKSKKK